MLSPAKRDAAVGEADDWPGARGGGIVGDAGSGGSEALVALSAPMLLEGLAAPGGAKPEENIGSDDPVRRDAAVAAAATL
jgi:hypothetical protein